VVQEMIAMVENSVLRDGTVLPVGVVTRSEHGEVRAIFMIYDCLPQAYRDEVSLLTHLGLRQKREAQFCKPLMGTKNDLPCYLYPSTLEYWHHVYRASSSMDLRYRFEEPELLMYKGTLFQAASAVFEARVKKGR
jgi:hypothetical protein